MKEYHKIQTVFRRDMSRKGRLIEGDFSLPEFAYLARNEWVFTEKVDGTNIRVMWDCGLRFNGKTDNAQIPAALWERLVGAFDAPKMAEVFAGPACLYGEGYGARIQKGGGNYKADGVDFVLFDVKIGDYWLLREDVEDVAQKLGIGVVPIIGRGDLLDMVKMAAEGFGSRWGMFPAEGIVARPAVELKTRSGQRIITKIKHKDFR